MAPCGREELRQVVGQVARVSQSPKIVPVTGYIGAEISDVDLADELAGTALRSIKEALYRYGVIIFRDQVLTSQQYVNLAEKFGPVSSSSILEAVPGFPIGVLIREPNVVHSHAEEWHHDQAYREYPTAVTVLYGVDVPEYGGDTAFINMAAVYESLSAGLRQVLLPLKATNRHSHIVPNASPEDIARRPGVATHPVVKIHPETGRKALFVDPGYTEGFADWEVEESAPLLDYIFRRALEPEFGMRLQWKKNTLVLWDNRMVWHRAINDVKGGRREMHRLVIE
jgi:taurine dioxygenase